MNVHLRVTPVGFKMEGTAFHVFHYLTKQPVATINNPNSLVDYLNDHCLKLVNRSELLPFYRIRLRH